MSDPFSLVEKQLASNGGAGVFDSLVETLRSEERFHELFDVRLMQTRFAQGRPLLANENLDELPEDIRIAAETAYLAACREAGAALAKRGKYRDAWMYLRPTGEKEPLASVLEEATPDEEQLEELIEVALYEGVAPRRGFEMALERWGTCNSITSLEGVLGRLSRPAQEETVTALVRHMHKELSGNVRGHIARIRPEAKQHERLADLIAENEWIFENESYHIDTSHLGSTVRLARLLQSPEEVRLAWELTEYGRRLAEKLRFDGEEPFVDLYPTHGLLYAATLGERVEEAIEYFRSRAEEISLVDEGTAALETYLILLTRLDRYGLALEEMARLSPAGVSLSPYAPRMLELSKKAGKIERYLEICRERNDLVGYAAGLVERSRG